MFRDMLAIDIDWPEHLGLYIVEVLIMLIAGVVKTIMQIYAAITIGHQAQNRTTLASIGAYILIMVFESTVGRMLLPLFDKLITVDADSFQNFSRIAILAIIAAAAFSVIYFFICKYLMEKRLNLN